jgi:hypothetical protein
MGFDIAPYGQAIAEVGGLLNGILKRVLPEKMSELEKAQIQQAASQELLRADWGALAGQLEINKAEASSSSLFVAGWRPYVGWVCGSALAYHFMLQPCLAFLIALYKWQAPPLPAFDMGSLMTILLGMLGLAGARTYEKVKGVAGAGK